MKVKELIKLLQDRLEPNAELDFLCLNLENYRGRMFWLDIMDIGMNVDVDDPNLRHRGGITFTTRKIKDEM